MRHLALSYGVEAIYMPELANGQEYYFAALRRLLKEGRLCETDMVGYLSSGKAANGCAIRQTFRIDGSAKNIRRRPQMQLCGVVQIRCIAA